jgi:hypothetical protein
MVSNFNIILVLWSVHSLSIQHHGVMTFKTGSYQSIAMDTHLYPWICLECMVFISNSLLKSGAGSEMFKKIHLYLSHPAGTVAVDVDESGRLRIDGSRVAHLLITVA